MMCSTKYFHLQWMRWKTLSFIKDTKQKPKHFYIHILFVVIHIGKVVQ